jgi:hypothetical protein
LIEATLPQWDVPTAVSFAIAGVPFQALWLGRAVVRLFAVEPAGR